MIAFLVFSVLSVFALSLSDMWSNSVSVKAMTKNGIWAYYAAQAGLEQGKAYASAVGETPASGANWLPCNSSNATVVNSSSCGYTDIAGNLSLGVPAQWYQFQVDGAAASRTVYAKGRAIGPNNATLAERRINVTVNAGAPRAANFSWGEW